MNIWQKLAIVIGISVIITGILAAIKRNSKHYLSLDWADVFMPIWLVAVFVAVIAFINLLVLLSN